VDEDIDLLRSQIKAEQRMFTEEQLLDVENAYCDQKLKSGTASRQAKSDYAFWLSRSSKSADILEGCRHFHEIVEDCIAKEDAEITDYLYYLAIAQFLVGDGIAAVKSLDQMLAITDSRQAQTLKELCLKTAKKQKFKAGAIAAGAIGGTMVALINPIFFVGGLATAGTLVGGAAASKAIKNRMPTREDLALIRREELLRTNAQKQIPSPDIASIEAQKLQLIQQQSVVSFGTATSSEEGGMNTAVPAPNEAGDEGQEEEEEEDFQAFSVED